MKCDRCGKWRELEDLEQLCECWANYNPHKICKDCGVAFTDPHDLFTKCDLCNERDLAWKEKYAHGG